MCQDKASEFERDLLGKRAGQEMQRLRLLRGLTQEQLGEKVGITSGSVSQLERGVFSPKFHVLAKIIDALDADANIFFDRQKDPLTDKDQRLASFLTSLSEEQRTSLHASMKVFLLMFENFDESK